MAVENLVVVGASLAGLRAVEAARKAGFAGRITLVGAEPHLPYDRPPLSKEFLGPGSDTQVTFRSRQIFEDDLDIELRLGTAATGLDLHSRHVLLGAERLPYDGLVIATGSTPRRLPGTDHLEGVHTLRSLDDALAIRAALDRGARLVVVGAGFIGSELASSARKRGLEATIIETLPTPLLRATGETMGAACALLHHDHGTKLRCGVGVEGLEGNGRVERVRLTDGSTIDADLVVVGIGVTPTTGWLETSGLTLDNGLVCDAHLHAGAPGVYGAGDVVRWPNALFGEQMRLEHWTCAAEQGAAAARNLLGNGTQKTYETVPYFWSDWYDSRIQFVGVPGADEIRVVHGSVEERQFVALYRRAGRLIGALAMNRPTFIMKYRVMISRSTSWDEALKFAQAAG